MPTKVETCWQSQIYITTVIDGGFLRQTKVRIKTLEQHIGFGMNAYVIGSFKDFGAIGAGYYYTMNCEQQNLFQYRQKGNFSLMLTAGIKMNIKKS